MKKIIIGIVIGIIISATTVYAASILSSSVVYDNSTSNGTSKTVQGALDELYSKIKYGTATAEDILKGKTALVQGEKVIGTMDKTQCLKKKLVYLGNTYTSAYTIPTSGLYNVFAAQNDEYGVPIITVNGNQISIKNVYNLNDVNFSTTMIYLNKGDIINHTDTHAYSYYGLQYITC